MNSVLVREALVAGIALAALLVSGYALHSSEKRRALININISNPTFFKAVIPERYNVWRFVLGE